MKRTLLSRGCAIALGLVLVSGVAASAVAQDSTEKNKKLSDRTVRVIMGTAFAGIPESLPKPNGEVVKLDRSDPKKFLIPLDDARRIIIKSVLSARADLCGLKDLERKHFLSIMRHEKALEKWTSYQLTYIDILHATTGIYMTGASATGDTAKKKMDGSEDRRNDYSCSPEERERVRAAVEAELKQDTKTQ
jgi:hypothetical protein